MLTDINFNDATRDAQQAPEDEGEQVFEFAAKTCKRHAVIKKIVMEFTFENGIAIPDELARKVCGLGDHGVVSHANGDTVASQDEEPCHFIHPALDSKEQTRVHEEIRNLVTRHQLKEIVLYLKKMADEKRILLPANADNAYKELERMGLPTGKKGFSLKNFYKEY